MFKRKCVYQESSMSRSVSWLLLGRLDNASPCVCMCVFFFKECVPRTICACATCGATSSMDGCTTHIQTHRHRDTHTDNHTTTHQTTQTHHTTRQPNPPWWNTAGTRAGGKGFFFGCRTQRFFFFEVGPFSLKIISDRES